MQVKSVLDTPIYHKTYELYRLLYSYHHTVLKLHRYTVWQKCEETTLEMLAAIIHTSHVQNAARAEAICLVSEKLDFLKTLVRLARETNTINQANYTAIQDSLKEIGRMTGGWLKSVPHPL